MGLPKENFTNSYIVYAFIRGLNFVIENDIRRTIKNEELTFPGFRILWILYFHTTLRMSELTFLAQTNISNVFRQLTKLKEVGLVVIENGDDARTKKIALTKDGRDIVKHFLATQTSQPELEITQFIENIPKEDLSAFIKVSTLLSNELIGPNFTNFVTKSVKDILSPSTPMNK